jgi:hypothetical protein
MGLLFFRQRAHVIKKVGLGVTFLPHKKGVPAQMSLQLSTIQPNLIDLNVGST